MKQNNLVILFIAPNCPWCKKAKIFFKKNNIKFNTVDVSKNKKALMIAKNMDVKGYLLY